MKDEHSKLDLSLWPTAGQKFGEPGKRRNKNENLYLLACSVFHPDIARQLHHSCAQTLLEYGVEAENIASVYVPGSFELAYAIASYARRREDRPIAAAIALGCIIQGKTRHFDYVCSGTVEALSHLNLRASYPVIFGVLTTQNRAEALERVDVAGLNKGKEFALTALWMANLNHHP